jgi:putative NADH-flavin reductase
MIRSVAVFGASGRTGQRLIEHAAATGLRLRMLARSSRGLAKVAERCEAIEGALLSPNDVERTLDGCDAVCCLFGPRPPYTDIFCAAATQIIVDAMARCGVPQIICQTGAMIGDYPRNRTAPFRLMVRSFRRRYPVLADDRADQERIVAQSDCTWMLLKPPRLTDGPPEANYIAGPEVRVGLLTSVSRATLARFIVSEIVAAKHKRQTVFIRSG